MSTVLVLHLGALGDSVLAWPILAALRRCRPTARLVLAGSGAKAELARHVRFQGRPLADATLCADGAEFLSLFSDGPTEPLQQRLVEVLAEPSAHAQAELLATPQPEQPAQPTRRSDSVVLSFLGPSDSHAHSRLRQVWPGPLWTIDGRAAAGRRVPILHQWAEQLTSAGAIDVVAALSPAPRFGWPTRSPSDPHLRYAVLAPGSGGRDKCWPLSRFRQTAMALRSQYGLATVWVLGEAELERGPRPDQLADEPAEVLVAPTLPDLAERLSGAALFVGNDSGPGHLAAALGTPTVTVFRRTDPLVWAPLGPRVRTVGAGLPVPPAYQPLACPWEPPAVCDPQVAEVLAAAAEFLQLSCSS